MTYHKFVCKSCHRYEWFKHLPFSSKYGFYDSDLFLGDLPLCGSHYETSANGMRLPPCPHTLEHFMYQTPLQRLKEWLKNRFRATCKPNGA